MSDFSQPCGTCRAGHHTQCTNALCGCLADHPGDEPIIAGFKRLKRQLHPEREAQVGRPIERDTP